MIQNMQRGLERVQINGRTYQHYIACDDEGYAVDVYVRYADIADHPGYSESDGWTITDRLPILVDGKGVSRG